MRKKMRSVAPIMKKIAPVLLVSAFLLPQPARAEIKAGSVEISPFVGFSMFQDRQNLENAPIIGGRLGYNFTEHFGVEASGQYMRSGVDNKSKPFTRQGQFTSPIDDVDIVNYHLDLLYHFMPESKFNPFVTAGYGAAHYSPRINNKNMSIIGAGVGAKYWVADNIALRVDVRDNMTTDEHIHNLESTMGVVFRFGGKDKEAPARVAESPAPAPVPVPAPADSDDDGVINSQDRCPNTPTRVAVDMNGCPLDSDKDGVADYLDKCPGTPAGVSVDSKGCPLDSDRDGVADYLDKCPGTPAGAAVDNNGCPLDSDQDTVADYLDKCPGTPAGVSIDKNGCPLDSDKDGVPDYLDKCLRTPAGVKVDHKGCPEVVMSKENKAAAAEKFCSKPAVLAINFETNKTDIAPQYYDELKTVGDFLAHFPEAKGEISGHADTVGTAKHNQTLSQGRADSVKQYIVDTFGTNTTRIGTKGYGYTKPVASNKTEAGRAKNRRIEANFTCQ